MVSSLSIVLQEKNTQIKIIEIYQDVEGYKNLCVTTQQDAKERLNWNVWQKKVEDIIAKASTRMIRS